MRSKRYGHRQKQQPRNNSESEQKQNYTNKAKQEYMNKQNNAGDINEIPPNKRKRRRQPSQQQRERQRHCSNPRLTMKYPNSYPNHLSYVHDDRPDDHSCHSHSSNNTMNKLKRSKTRPNCGTGRTNSMTDTIESDRVPVDTVLRSILDQSRYPYLYIIEYISRRCRCQNTPQPLGPLDGMKAAPAPAPLVPPKLDRVYREFLEDSRREREKRNSESSSHLKRRRRTGKRQRRRWNGHREDSEDLECHVAKTKVGEVEMEEEVLFDSITPNDDLTVTDENFRRIDTGNNDDDLNMIYQLLARTIVIPYSDHLISMVARKLERPINISNMTLPTPPPSTAIAQAIVRDRDEQQSELDRDKKESNSADSADSADCAVVINRYKRSSQRRRQHTAIPTTYQCNESTIGLVDGVISVLVQRRETTRRRLRLGIPIGGRQVERGDATSFNTALSGHDSGGKGRVKRKKKAFKSYNREEYEQMCRVRNVLAEGYSLIGPTTMVARGRGRVGGFSANFIASRRASSEDTNFITSNTINNKINNDDNTDSINNEPYTKRQQRPLQASVMHCENMAPGIQCTHPNSLASYARTSPLISTLHKMIGDDLMRELLLHCIVLVPAGVVGMRKEKTIPCCPVGTKGVGGTIDRGNYFQLSGPPLNVLKSIVGSTLNYDQDSSKIISPLNDVQRTGVNKNKRKRDGRKESDVLEKETVVFPGKILQSGKGERDVGSDTSNTHIESEASNTTNLRNKQKKNDPIPSKDGDCTKTKQIIASCIQGTVAQNPSSTIPRHLIFYCESFVKHVGFPPSHILNRLCGGSHGDDEKSKTNGISLEEELLYDIIHLHRHSVKQQHVGRVGDKQLRRYKRTKRWKRLRYGGIDICKQVLRGHKKCDYARLLERYCPLGDYAINNGQKFGKNLCKNGADEGNCLQTLPKLISSYCNCNQVKSFLSAVLKHVFPLEFWGSKHNFEVTLNAVGTFVNLRRMEQFPLKLITHGIRVLDIKWLFHSRNKDHCSSRRKKVLKSDHEAATILMQSQFYWLYCRFLIPLLRCCFYITDTQFTGKSVVHYRKPVWSILKSIAIDELLKRQYTELSMTQGTSKSLPPSLSQKMGYARLRLLPKKTGIRPIAVLCKRLNISTMDGRLLYSKKSLKSAVNPVEGKPKPKLSINSILRETFDVLKFERISAPHKFGAGLSGCHEVYPRLLKFLHNFRSRLEPIKTRNIDPLYFASVDIYHCYDNIDQSHLYNLISAIISEDEYLIQKHAIVHPFDGKSSKSRCKVRKVVGAPGGFVRFLTLVEELANHHSDSIMLDGIHCHIAKKEDILGLIKEHLSNHVVVAKRRFGPQILIQNTGIPQGSVLSTMLCNYYYGDMEKQFLDGVFLTTSDDIHKHLIVRMVDDFLLVTTDRKTFERFMTKTSKGVPSFGVQINKKKSRVSHALDIENSDGIKCHLNSSCVTLGGNQYFPWCGMLFNVDTCAVRVDYSRFTGSIADSLTIDRIEHEGLHLERRMKTFVKPRCQPIFFDPLINSARDIKINYYHAIAFCAVKTLSSIAQGMKGGVGQNVGFIEKCIDNVIAFTYTSINKSIRQANGKEPILDHGANNTHVLSWLRKDEAIWLASHAFKSVFLSSSHVEYAPIIKNLERTLTRVRSLSICPHALDRLASRALIQFNLDNFKIN